MWINFLMVAVGGACGTLCRYGVSLLANRQVSSVITQSTENAGNAGASIAAGGVGGVAGVGGVDVGGGVSSGFPWATLVVNLLGCFLFGFIAEGIAERAHLRQTAQLLLLTGFMGAFTTFSTFGHETLSMMRQGQWGLMGVNVAIHNVFGLLMVGIGVWLAHTIWGRGA